MNTTKLGDKHPVETKESIEYQTSGKFGHGKISISPTGLRKVEIIWRGKPPLFAPSSQVDLLTSKSNSLREALDKACHNTGFLPILRQETIKGPKAMIEAFYRNSKNEGYATITKSGSKPLRFSLNRIDLKAMNCNCPQQALRKVAFVSGSIKLISIS